MKRLVCAVLSIFLIFFSCIITEESSYALVDTVSTSAGASILYCANNGRVIYANRENAKMKMASTTKLLTTLLTLEFAEKNDKIVTFKRSMIEEGSSMYLKVGEKVHIDDLCIGMMLPSGNDAATAAAVTVAGSKEKFADLMNKRAKSIGMQSSHFVTPSGLDDDNHYTTAYDMALLMTECLKNKKFKEISGSVNKTVAFVSPNDKTVTYHNHNRLLSEYPYCISGKTGYTMAAGRCLVTAAEKNGITLVAVTLNDKNDWQDHKSLYDYGFSVLRSKHFKSTEITQTVVGGKENSVEINIPQNSFVLDEDDSKIKRKIMIEPFAYAPVKQGERAGMVLYYQKGKVIDKKSLVYKKSVGTEKTEGGFFSFLKSIFGN